MEFIGIAMLCISMVIVGLVLLSWFYIASFVVLSVILLITGQWVKCKELWDLSEAYPENRGCFVFMIICFAVVNLSFVLERIIRKGRAGWKQLKPQSN